MIVYGSSVAYAVWLTSMNGHRVADTEDAICVSDGYRASCSTYVGCYRYIQVGSSKLYVSTRHREADT